MDRESLSDLRALAKHAIAMLVIERMDGAGIASAAKAIKAADDELKRMDEADATAKTEPQPTTP